MIYTIHDENEFAMRWTDVSKTAFRGLQAGPVVIELGRQKRSNSQNRKMWPLLRDVSEQVIWNEELLPEETWKMMFLSAMGEASLVEGICGELVQVSGGTSRLNKKQFQDLIELIYAFGSEHGVEWSDEGAVARARGIF